MTHAYVALGSNLDNPRAHIEGGFSALAGLPDTQLLRRSSLFRTLPWGYAAQPEFVNAVAEIDTRHSPQQLLTDLQAIERAHGRDRSGPRWGPRTLDLDLLLYGGQRVDTPQLQLPHPRIAARAFVLLPLAELGADLEVPGQGRVVDLLARVDASGCWRIDGTD